MTAELTFIAEIENAVASTSAGRRSEMAHKIADLFVSRWDEVSPEDVSLLDEAIVRLAAAIEQSARALLARRLAPFRNSPRQTIRLLAFDDAIEVAGPVLTQSAQLDDETLVEIARMRGQDHMLAISHRGSLNETVTDILIELGNRDVLLSTADNHGASLSDQGFSALVRRSGGDDLLAEFVGSRPEIPSHLLAELVAKASQKVRAKLEAAHPRAKEEVFRAVAEAAGRVEARMRSTSLDYTSALAAIETLKRSGSLDDGALAAFAKSGAYAETIAALSVMCDLPLQFVEQAMARDRSESLVVLARAVGLSWSTVNEILQLRAQRGLIPRGEIIQRLARFERLRPDTAQEIVRLHRARARGNGAPASSLDT